jgi:hypothetical protein
MLIPPQSIDHWPPTLACVNVRVSQICKSPVLFEQLHTYKNISINPNNKNGKWSENSTYLARESIDNIVTRCGFQNNIVPHIRQQRCTDSPHHPAVAIPRTVSEVGYAAAASQIRSDGAAFFQLGSCGVKNSYGCAQAAPAQMRNVLRERAKKRNETWPGSKGIFLENPPQIALHKQQIHNAAFASEELGQVDLPTPLMGSRIPFNNIPI